MIPWRVKNQQKQKRDLPLGAEFNVGRWLHEGHLSPNWQIPLRDSYVVAPDYPGPKPKKLAHSADEVRLVTSIFPGDRIHPANVDTISEHVTNGARSLLHFVCHGNAESQIGIQEIYLEGGNLTLSSLEVGDIEALEQAFRARKTLVFLNACEVGRNALALVGIGGFAKEFIQIGAAGVIAPLWSVRDSIAFEVARHFYGEIRKHPDAGFAEILGRVRKLAYARGGEDTYAAYCFYGDPQARSGN
jgi:hypothetical protein